VELIKTLYNIKSIMMVKYNILFALFVSVLTETVSCQGLPTPISALEEGYKSLLLYLRRPEDGDRYTPFKSTAANNGHFYYPISIGNATFDL